MNAADFRTLREAFHAVIDLAPDARQTHLAQLATHDPELHEAVLGLLANLAETDLQSISPDAEAVPLQVGPYRLGQMLGSGGMGEVYLAERVDGGFEQRVALKLVRRGGLSRQLTRRFLRERQILARLEHPNIARLLDGGFTASGQPWLAMDYIAGETIANHVRQRQLGLDARVALIARVATAVAYAQRNLVVHRDIKPANILVGADGEPKLLDFGIAKLLDDSTEEQTRTALRAMTTRYAAPEQIAGDRTTTATDVYALGVLLFELITERSPYVTDGSGDWTSAVLREPPRTLAHACAVDYATRERRMLGGGLERIVQKALAKAPAQRYAGAAALADDLDDWLARRPLRSGIGSAREQTRQLIARYRWPLTVVAATMLALGAGAIVAWRQARIAAEQARVARAHLEAMLGVLGSANPQYYAGRDPHASEFLRTAADTLQRERADDPALLQRALSEIGHGLINLGKPQDAEAVLRAAAVQLERDASATAAGKLGTYKLLAAVQDEPRYRDALHATADRIEALAADVDAAVAIDAIGGVAGSLGKLGEFERAARLFARGDALLAQAGSVRPGAVENYWRQRGWSALRAFELDRARESFLRGLAQIEAAPQSFSPMRRAEAERLLAETLLTQSDAAAAQTHLAAAQPVYYAEYPPDHIERAAFDLLKGRLLLLQGDAVAAQTIAAEAARVLEHSQGADKDQLTRRWLLADIAAQRGDCAAANADIAVAVNLLAGFQPALPRDHALVDAAARRVAAACAKK